MSSLLTVPRSALVTVASRPSSHVQIWPNVAGPLSSSGLGSSVGAGSSVNGGSSVNLVSAGSALAVTVTAVAGSPCTRRK